MTDSESPGKAQGLNEWNGGGGGFFLETNEKDEIISSFISLQAVETSLCPLATSQ